MPTTQLHRDRLIADTPPPAADTTGDTWRHLADTFADTTPVTWWAVAATVALAATAYLLITRRTPTPTPARPEGPSRAPRVMYGVALLAMAVSADTSWRFFGVVLGIDGWERVVMFAVLEYALIACGVVMRSQARRGLPPGQVRLFLWVLVACAVAFAVMLSGLLTGIARVALGPALGTWALHIALGIDLRAHRAPVTGTWARLTAEAREWLLSLIGLGDGSRDAVTMRRDRAARRAARHAHALRAAGARRFAPGRRTRTRLLARALRASNAAHDPAARATLLREQAALTTLDTLIGLRHASPWTSVDTPGVATPDTPGDTSADTGVATPGDTDTPGDTAPTSANAANDTSGVARADTTTVPDTTGSDTPDTSVDRVADTGVATAGAGDTGSVAAVSLVPRAVTATDLMRAHYFAERHAGRTPTGTELAAHAGVSASLARRCAARWSQEWTRMHGAA